MSDLYTLYRLHKIDSAMYGLKMEAESLDLGRAEKAVINEVSKQYDEIGARAKALTIEIKDKEIEQKGIADKITQINKKIFDGSVVSPREIENMQKEIAMLKVVSEKNDERLFELYDESPSVIKEAEDLKVHIDEIKTGIDSKTSTAVARHNDIKSEFDTLRGKRKIFAAEVDATLLSQYEAVRKRTGSTGVAQVSETNTCEHCGMAVPIKQRELLKDDKISLCEGCHRILFMAVLVD